MAVINLKVTSNFDAAAKDLKEFGATSEAQAKKIKKFQESFKSERIDNFIDRNKRATAAIKATRGPAAALAAEHRALQREIEKLIRNGIDPQDKALEKLRKEYDRTTREINQNTKAEKLNAIAVKAAKTAAFALAAAAAAVAVATVKATVETAKMGDEYAKTGRRIGITAEELQELEFAADRQGVSGETLRKSLEKLNKNVGDLKGGFGDLKNALKDTNPELLESLKNAKNNEEAFSLTINALDGMEDQLKKASVAQAVFGRSGMQLLNIAEGGTDAIAGLREEARSYGVISNEAAAQSEAFVDATTNLKASISGLAKGFLSELIPAVTPAIQKIADFVAAIREMKEAEKADEGGTASIQQRILLLEKENKEIAETLVRKQQSTLFSIEQLEAAEATARARLVANARTLQGLNLELVAQKAVILEQEAAATAAEEEAASQLILTAAKEESLAVEQNLSEERQKAFEQTNAFRKEIESLANNELPLLSEAEKDLFKPYIVGAEEAAEKTASLGEIFRDNLGAIASVGKSVWSALGSFQDAFFQNQLSGLEKGSDEYKKVQKEQFEVGKKMAAANAAIAGFEGAIQAYKALAGIPVVGPALGIGAAALIGGFAAAQVANISSQQVPAFASGGSFVTNGPQLMMVGDNSGGKERVDITPVSSPNINGPQGGNSYNVTINNLFSLQSDAQLRQAASQLWTGLESEAKRRGLTLGRKIA